MPRTSAVTAFPSSDGEPEREFSRPSTEPRPVHDAAAGDLRTAVVIEDDLDVRNLLCAILEQGGFHASGAATGREGVDAVRKEDPAVVTLDIGLPDIDGYEVLRRIRATSDCYVIVLSGCTDEMDVLTALHTGADDFVLKPFRPRELRARIDAMLRRPRVRGSSLPTTPRPADDTADGTPEGAAGAREDAGLLCNGDLVVDSQSRTATCSGVEIPLTKTEFNLLHELLRGNGAVRTKEDLVRVSRGKEYRGYNFVSRTDERAIEVHIANLRQKLARTSEDPDFITTVRGVGFRIMPRRSASR